jgi:hypothetical protein
MSAPQGGLILCQETRPNNTEAYYAKATDGVLTFPTLVAPVSILPADESTTASIYVRGSDETVYRGAITVAPGANSSIPASQANGITIRTGAGPSTIAEVGSNSQGPNLLYIAGASGVSQVYDVKYNPVIKATPVATYSGSIPANTGPGLWTYTPDVSGAYMLQVNFNVENADSIPINGAIEWVLNVGGGEVQYCSSTLKSTSISKASDFDEVNGVPGVLAPPMDYSFSNMATLTAGEQVSFYLATARNSVAGGGAWAISNYQVRLIKMC